MNLNQCTFAGNLTADPELRYTPKGMAIASGQLAVNRKWTTPDGEKKEEASFIPYTAFDKTAENMAKHTAKGLNVCLVGRMRTETWQDKATGQNRSKLSLVVEQAHFIQWKDNGEGQAGRPAASPARQRPLTGPEAHPGGAAAAVADNIGEDSIPF